MNFKPFDCASRSQGDGQQRFSGRRTWAQQNADTSYINIWCLPFNKDNCVTVWHLPTGSYRAGGV